MILLMYRLDAVCQQITITLLIYVMYMVRLVQFKKLVLFSIMFCL